MTKDEIVAKHGSRLREVLGEGFEQHPKFEYVVREMQSGTRLFSNVISDISTPDPRAARRW